MNNPEPIQIESCSGETSSVAEWNRFVHSRPEASFYHLYEWRGYFSSCFRCRSFYIGARDSAGRLRGILPLVQQKSRLFGNFLTSVPFLNYGGALADDPGIARALMDRAAELAREAGASHVEFRDVAPVAGLPQRTDKVTMILELPDSEEALATALGAKLRSQIRRADREHPEVRVGAADLVDAFYAVFSRNMRDLGTPVYAKSMFVDLLGRFPDESSIVAIGIGGEPVAAAFLLKFRETTEIPWASSLRSHNRVGANMLLYWEALRQAIRTGSRRFDFGRSSIDSGTFRFKQQWGARPRQLYWHYWLRNPGQIPALNPGNAKYRLAVRAWQKLPLPIANRLGPYLVRNLP